MSLQYLDALKALGAGPATKFILPMEFTNLLKPLIDYTAKEFRGQGLEPRTQTYEVCQASEVCPG